MKMTLNRDHVHYSTVGLSVKFKKDVPTWVAPRLIREIMALGGVAVEEDKALEAAEMAQINQAQTDADSRAPAIEAGIRKLVARNQRGDFTAGGRPNLRVMFTVTGLDISQAELDPVWDRVKKELEQ